MNPVTDIVIATFVIVSSVNNVINILLYEGSSGEAEITSDSYTEESISRQDKLDYTKQETGEDHYNLNAWRYYSEYTLHQWGWQLTSWAYEQDIPIISDLAESFVDANVDNNEWDSRWYVNAFTFVIGILGF